MHVWGLFFHTFFFSSSFSLTEKVSLALVSRQALLKMLGKRYWLLKLGLASL